MTSRSVPVAWIFLVVVGWPTDDVSAQVLTCMHARYDAGVCLPPERCAMVDTFFKEFISYTSYNRALFYNRCPTTYDRPGLENQPTYVCCNPKNTENRVILNAIEAYQADPTKGGLLPAPNECGQLALRPTGRSVNGSPVPPNRYPWLGALLSNGKLKCGCSLISRRYVLTAMHCILASRPTPTHVALGVHDYRQCTTPANCAAPARIYAVAGLRSPTAEYGPTNDLLLVELAADVEFTDVIRPICLPPVRDIARGVPDAPAWLAGHGATSEDTSNVPHNTPLEYRGTLTERHPACNITSSWQQVCFMGDGSQVGCSGDSGSAIMTKDGTRYVIESVLSGSASPGSLCPMDKPMAGPRIASFMGWIYTVVDK